MFNIVVTVSLISTVLRLAQEFFTYKETSPLPVKGYKCMFSTFDCLFVLSRTSNFSAIWRLSPLPATGPMLSAYGF
jgi:hypothetical protein